MKNIVLTTGYSLLTAFFLCTPPLCAQEKVLDRMTRSEARQEILRHTGIKDHVTFYHSNDKDIYVVYDLVSSGNKEKMLQGKTILLGILDAFRVYPEPIPPSGSIFLCPREIFRFHTHT